MALIFEKFKLDPKRITADYTHMLFRCIPDGIIWRFRKYFDGLIIQDVIDGNEWQDSYSSEDEVQDAILGDGADGDLFARFLSCFASEFARIESRAFDLLNESDPGVAVETLEDWERVLGLPELCFADLELTTDERQAQAHAKRFYTGVVADAQFYIDYAEALGFTITVEELPSEVTARIFGRARFGKERFGGRGGYSILKITIVDGESSNDILKCIFNEIKPAHVIITYVEL